MDEELGTSVPHSRGAGTPTCRRGRPEGCRVGNHGDGGHRPWVLAKAAAQHPGVEPVARAKPFDAAARRVTGRRSGALLRSRDMPSWKRTARVPAP